MDRGKNSEGGATKYEGEDDHNNTRQTGSWVIDFTRQLEEGQSFSSTRPATIYRVPDDLRDVYEKAFVPKMVSIGPLNYKERKGRLRLIEEHKKRYLANLLRGQGSRAESVGDPNNSSVSSSVCLKDLVSAMEELENQARACYSESFSDISSSDFVQMLVVDGCFIVQLLRLFYDLVTGPGEIDDPIFTTRWILRTLLHDLLLLENQLPFFVLRKLSNLTETTGSDAPILVPLEYLIVDFFDVPPRKLNEESELGAKVSYDHLLDFVHSRFLEELREKDQQSVLLDDGPMYDVTRYIPVYNARDLQERGVKLQRRRCSGLLDIAFDRGTLQIPQITINDMTVPLLLNLVAYEQCAELDGAIFTSHFVFLDSLVDSSDDIVILRRHGILNQAIGSNDDVVSLLHRLGRQLVSNIDGGHSCKVISKMNKYVMWYDRSVFRRPWMMLWRSFIRKYFSSPWTFLSMFGAIILLFLTLVQTIYAVSAYYG